MRELEGRSYAEIAEILETSVSAVETLLFRARRALREQLEGTLTCAEAERAISRQTDGLLTRPERSALRAHLRQCRECERLGRSQRAHKKAFKALALVPIPTSLTSLFGGGGAVVGGGVALKAAAFVAAGVVATGVGYEGARELSTPSRQPEAVVPATTAAARPAAPIVAPLRAPGSKGRAAAASDKNEKARTSRGRLVAPGQVSRQAKPGQAKKQSASTSGVRVPPPGQVRKAALRTSNLKPAPPGQAKKAQSKRKKGAGGRP
jgi:hypothetical protein